MASREDEPVTSRWALLKIRGRAILRKQLGIGGFDYFKLETDLFAARHEIQVMLPDLAEESEAWIPVVQVNQEFKPSPSPDFEQGHSRGNLAVADVSIKGEVDPVIGEVSE